MIIRQSAIGKRVEQLKVGPNNSFKRLGLIQALGAKMDRELT